MHPNEQQDSVSISFGKMFLLIGLMLAGLTFFFSGILSKQYNPNQSPAVLIDALGNREVTLQRNRFGHYLSAGRINGIEFTFMLDTGATQVAIPGALEKQLKLTRGREILIETANGTAVGYLTRLDTLVLGNIQLNNVAATIAPGMDSDEILLGMSVLKQLDFEQQGNQLILRISKH